MTNNELFTQGLDILEQLLDNKGELTQIASMVNELDPSDTFDLDQEIVQRLDALFNRAITLLQDNNAWFDGEVTPTFFLENGNA